MFNLKGTIKPMIICKAISRYLPYYYMWIKPPQDINEGLQKTSAQAQTLAH